MLHHQQLQQQCLRNHNSGSGSGRAAATATLLLCCPRPHPWLAAAAPTASHCCRPAQRSGSSSSCRAAEQRHSLTTCQRASAVLVIAAAAAVLPPPPHQPQQQQQPEAAYGDAAAAAAGDQATDQLHQQYYHHQQQPPAAALGLPALPPSVLQHSPQQLHRHPQLLRSSAGAPVDPTALCITDRVRLLTSNAAARRRSTKPRAGGATGAAGAPVNVPQFCAAAGVSGAASAVVQQHVRSTQISATPEVLGPFLASYLRLCQAYGEPVVLEWLKKASPVIRAEEEVPGRLLQLQQLLGPRTSHADVLALTKRCPQVLQVSRTLVAQRMQQLCSLLGRDPAAEACKLLTGAPALLAMHPQTLEVKAQQLTALAATHPSWAEAYSSCPSKSLAVLLTYSLERQLRLHYAAAFGLQAKLQMNTVMAWSKRDWLKAHPNFEEWCTLYKRQQQQQQLAAQVVMQQQQQHQEQLELQQQQQQVPAPMQRLTG